MVSDSDTREESGASAVTPRYLSADHTKHAVVFLAPFFLTAREQTRSLFKKSDDADYWELKCYLALASQPKTIMFAVIKAAARLALQPLSLLSRVISDMAEKNKKGKDLKVWYSWQSPYLEDILTAAYWLQASGYDSSGTFMATSFAGVAEGTLSDWVNKRDYTRDADPYPFVAKAAYSSVTRNGAPAKKPEPPPIVVKIINWEIDYGLTQLEAYLEDMGDKFLKGEQNKLINSYGLLNTKAVIEVGQIIAHLECFSYCAPEGYHPMEIALTEQCKKKYVEPLKEQEGEVEATLATKSNPRLEYTFLMVATIFRWYRKLTASADATQKTVMIPALLAAKYWADIAHAVSAEKPKPSVVCCCQNMLCALSTRGNPTTIASYCMKDIVEETFVAEAKAFAKDTIEKIKTNEALLVAPGAQKLLPPLVQSIIPPSAARNAKFSNHSYVLDVTANKTLEKMKKYSSRHPVSEDICEPEGNFNKMRLNLFTVECSGKTGTFMYNGSFANMALEPPFWTANPAISRHMGATVLSWYANGLIADLDTGRETDRQVPRYKPVDRRTITVKNYTHTNGVAFSSAKPKFEKREFQPKNAEAVPIQQTIMQQPKYTGIQNNEGRGNNQQFDMSLFKTIDKSDVILPVKVFDYLGQARQLIDVGLKELYINTAENADNNKREKQKAIAMYEHFNSELTRNGINIRPFPPLAAPQKARKRRPAITQEAGAASAARGEETPQKKKRRQYKSQETVVEEEDSSSDSNEEDSSEEGEDVHADQSNNDNNTVSENEED